MVINHCELQGRTPSQQVLNRHTWSAALIYSVRDLFLSMASVVCAEGARKPSVTEVRLRRGGFSSGVLYCIVLVVFDVMCIY